MIMLLFLLIRFTTPLVSISSISQTIRYCKALPYILLSLTCNCKRIRCLWVLGVIGTCHLIVYQRHRLSPVALIHNCSPFRKHIQLHPTYQDHRPRMLWLPPPQVLLKRYPLAWHLLLQTPHHPSASSLKSSPSGPSNESRQAKKFLIAGQAASTSTEIAFSYEIMHEATQSMHLNVNGRLRSGNRVSKSHQETLGLSYQATLLSRDRPHLQCGESKRLEPSHSVTWSQIWCQGLLLSP